MSDWNDDKGFGFVVPNGGGDRALVHIKEFQRGSRRPVVGDLISYLPGKDAKGRLQAREIRHADQKVEAPKPPSSLPRATLGIIALACIAVAVAAGVLPAALAGAYFALSALAYLMYLFDKSAAQRGSRRTPEANLHLVGMLGGWPGALVAQQQFRHKTVKASFQWAFWFTVAINLAAVGWLVSSGTSAAWAR